MPFRPSVNQQLVVDNTTYYVAEHPAAPGMPYGQEGRQGIVYALMLAASPVTPHGALPQRDRQAAVVRRAAAVKVFKPHYRLPSLAGLADVLAPFANLPGLRVCRRTVLLPHQHGELLREHPDLTYAMLMPWIDGPTWMEVVLDRRALSPDQSLTLARALADTLSRLEQSNVAHGDLSAPNLMLPSLAESGAGPAGVTIELVDVEQMYAPTLPRPAVLPSSSPGYAHRAAGEGAWGPEADRFAGAVLLSEMLGWCDARVRAMACQESCFAQNETQAETERYRTLVSALREHWGNQVTALLARAWCSETLKDCPTFGEWVVALPRPAVPEVTTVPPGGDEARVGAQLMQARRFRREGDLSAALTLYRRIVSQLPPDSPVLREVLPIIAELESASGAALPSARQVHEAAMPAGTAGHESTRVIRPPTPAAGLPPGDHTFLMTGPGDASPATPAPAGGTRPRRGGVPIWVWLLLCLLVFAMLMGAGALIVGRGLYRQAQATTTLPTQGSATAEAAAVAYGAATTAAGREATAAAIAAAAGMAEASATAQAGVTVTAGAHESATALARQAVATANAVAEGRALAEADAIANALAATATTAARSQATHISQTATASVPTPTPVPPPTATPRATPTVTNTPTPTETPGPTATVPPTASPTPSLAGKLAFSLPQSTAYKTYVVAVAPQPPTKPLASVDNARQPALSHDGMWLLVNGTGGAVESIARLTSDGHQMQAATCPASTGASGRPTWSPDDTHIAFDGLEADPAFPTIYIQRTDEIDCDLVDNKLLVAGGPVVDTNGLYPLWGPDNRIYFRGCATWDPAGAGECGLWSVQPDGADVRRLADNPNYLPTDVGRERLLFMSGHEGNWEIYSIDLGQGGPPQNLTNSPAVEVWGALSPEGGTIAFLSNRSGVWSLWLADADGSDAHEWLPLRPEWGEVDPNRMAEERMSWSR